MPLKNIPRLFPLVVDLDLSCEEWGRGQSLTSDTCQELSSLHLLNSLKSLRLHNWTKLSKNGLDLILSLPHLHTLDLTNCSFLSDTAFLSLLNTHYYFNNNLSQFDKKTHILKSLSLNQCHQLSDPGIESICKIYSESLEVLKLSGLENLTASCFSSPELKMTNLKELDLSASGINNEGLNTIIATSSRNLEILNISNCAKLSSTVFSEIPKLKQLRKLIVSQMAQLTSIEGWDKMTKLEWLDVSDSPSLVMSRVLTVINRMHKLERLELQWCPLFEGVEAVMLKDLKALTILDISGWQDVEFGFELGIELPQLRKMKLSHCGGLMTEKAIINGISRLNVLDISGFRYLPNSVSMSAGQAPNLVALDLSSLGNLSDDMIKSICASSSIQHLNISQDGITSKISNAGVMHLRHLKRLMTLYISGFVNVSDFSFISKMTQLKELDISTGLRLTDRGLKYMERLKALKYLNLSNCFQVTCEGMKKSLSALRELEKVVVSVNVKGDVGLALPHVKCISESEPLDQADKALSRCTGVLFNRHFS